jgi:hypothetical protein
MRGLLATVTGCVLVAALGSAGGAAAADPYCTGSYGTAPPRAGGPLRFGIDPGLAGSAGGVQLPSTPDDPAKDLAAVKALAPKGRQLVVRLNRLFWSDGQAGINAFKNEVARYARAGFDAELQVRYHPPSGEAGDIPAWLSYVRHVVDTFGPDKHVVSMTITNEVNLTFSPNTSDGSYTGAQAALIRGIEAAHAEAARRRFRQLRFGFTYAYRFSPQGDASFFAYLGSHGGRAFQAALGFVGLDFYPGTVYPPAMAPGDTYTAEFGQAAGAVRNCFMPIAGIGRATPIWITENGIPSGGACSTSGLAGSAPLESSGCANSDAQQAAALTELVKAANAYSGTFNITDYRWFNLRDSTSTGPSTLVGVTFSSDGLLRDDYTTKPSFSAYRALISRYGLRSPARPSMRPPCHPRARPCRHRKPGSFPTSGARRALIQLLV